MNRLNVVPQPFSLFQKVLLFFKICNSALSASITENQNINQTGKA